METKVLGNRYYIKRQLGEGGMATVYLAKDGKLERNVAIKILHEQFAKNKDIRDRFQLEARAISSLDQRNILRVYDFSGANAKQLWIVTEIINGYNIAEIIEKTSYNKFHPVVAALIIREVLKALSKAHKKSIVHRDVKAENIMITDSGLVKLMDFGIAKEMNKNGMTITGTFMGSPCYMSPEQIKGKNIDLRTDLYSLSVLFYEILCGRLPFNGRTTHDITMKIMAAKYTNPEIIINTIPAQLAEIIKKGISFDRNLRFQSATEMGAKLDNFLNKIGLSESHIELERYFNNKKLYLDKLLKIEKLKLSNNLTTTPKKPFKTQVSKEVKKNINHTPKQNNFMNKTPKQPLRQTTVKHTNIKRVNRAPRPLRKPVQFIRQKKPVITVIQTRQNNSNKLFNFIISTAIIVLVSLIGFKYTKKMKSHSTPLKKTVLKKTKKKTSFSKKTLKKVKPKILKNKLPSKKNTYRVEIKEPNKRLLPKNTLVVKNEKYKPTFKTGKIKTVKKNNNVILKKDLRIKKLQLSTKTQPNTKTQFITKETTQKVAVIKNFKSKAKTSVQVAVKPLLQVSSTPPSEIYINNHFIGTTLDKKILNKFIKLDVGKHRVVLKRKGYNEYTKNIRLSQRQKLVLPTITLTKAVKTENNFLLELKVNNPPVKITIIDEQLKTKEFNLTTNSMKVPLEKGRYQIKARKNKQSKERFITISNKQDTLVYNIEFKGGQNDN